MPHARRVRPLGRELRHRTLSMPPSKVEKKKPAAKPTLNVETASIVKGSKPTPRSKRSGQVSDRPKLSKRGDSPSRPADLESTPLEAVSEEKLLSAMVETDVARARAEESERKAGDLSQLLAERTSLATKEAEGRALAEKRAADAEEKLQAVMAALAAAEARAASAEKAAGMAPGTAVAATQGAHVGKSDAFTDAELLRVEAETRASAAEARAAEAAMMARHATELAQASAAEASASAARAKVLEDELAKLLRGAGSAGAGGNADADPVAEAVDGIMYRVQLSHIEELLARSEAKVVHADQRADRAEAALEIARQKMKNLAGAQGVNEEVASVGKPKMDAPLTTADSGAKQSSVLRQEMSGGAATPRRNENSANDLPAFTEKQLKAATKIEAVSRGRMQRQRSKAAAMKAVNGTTEGLSTPATAPGFAAECDGGVGPFTVNIDVNQAGDPDTLQVRVLDTAVAAAS